MARTGRFGRQPRAVPSLTATLVAIAREQERTRDQNIMEAWRGGGLFEGKPVTDDIILTHWRDRLKGIDPDDPLYDTYRTAVMQYEYAIAESKMTAAYALKADPTAGDDAAMANFYLNWAKRVPADSEFYRVLQRDAGQFLRSAKAKGQQRVRDNSEERYRNQMLAIERQKELPGQNVLKLVTMLGQRGAEGRGAVLGESPLGSPSDIANRTNLTDVSLPAADEMMWLLRQVDIQSPGFGGVRTSERNVDSEVLFHDESGAPVTRGAVAAQLRALDPTWDGKFDLNYVGRLVSQQKKGLKDRIALARSTGHVNDAAQLETQMAKVNEIGNQVQAWPVLEAYQDLKTDLDRVMQDNSLLPAAKLAAIDRVRGQIGALADDPRIASDDHMQSQLRGEAEGKVGTITLMEDVQGFRGGYDAEAMDASKSEVANIQSIRDLLAEQVELTSDPGSGYVMTQGDYVADEAGGMRFLPSAGGAAIGAALITDVYNAPGAGAPVTVYVPNGDGGGATPMLLVPAPVVATARRADGRPVNFKQGNQVTTFIRYTVNGKEITLFSMNSPQGQRWTADPPWNPALAQMRMAANGSIELDLSRVADSIPVPTEGATTGQDLGGGFSLGRVSEAGGNPALVMDAATAVFSTQPERQAAGPDARTDSFSPSIAALQGSPEGDTLLQQFGGSPTFRALVEQDAYASAGYTLDPATGEYVGGNAVALGFSLNAMNRVINKAEGRPERTGERDLWYRDGTDTEVRGANGETVRGVIGRGAAKDRRLPAEVLSAMDEGNRMAALGNAFVHSNILRTPQAAQQPTTPSIKTGITLTTPAVEPSSLSPVTGKMTTNPYARPTSASIAPTAPPPSPVVSSSPEYGSVSQPVTGGGYLSQDKRRV